MVHSSLRQFDTGMDRIEMVSLVTINNLIDEIAQFKAAAICPKYSFYFATMNIISSFLIGKTYERGSEYHQAFLGYEKAVQTILKHRGNGAIMDSVPFMKYIFDLLKVEGEVYMKAVRRLTDALLRESEKADEDGITESLVHKMRQAIDRDDLDIIKFRHSMVELIGDGSFTTTGVSEMFVNLMIHYPDVQKRLQQEVDDVLGNRQVSLKDRESMPYLMAGDK